MFYDKDGNPCDTHKWAEGFKNNKVVEDTVNGHLVSTVYIGIDHNYFDSGKPPLIYETMIFPDDGSLMDEYCERYATRLEALKGHVKAIAECLNEPCE